jgi:hypothetical protein
MLRNCLMQKLIVILLSESVGFSLRKDLRVLLIVFCALCTAGASTSSTASSESALPESLIMVEPLLACSGLIVFSAVISALEIFFIAITV